MGRVHFIITLIAIIISVFGAPALATDFVVGDEYGWTLNFDYQSWAMGKEFHVGDTLLFHYYQGDHNVYKVDGSGFKQCSAEAALGAALSSGFDVVTLSSPGKKWYICGVGNHCANGMKLVINVLPEVVSPAPAPAPTDYFSPGSPWSY